jgi:hypothetical protein
MSARKLTIMCIDDRPNVTIPGYFDVKYPTDGASTSAGYVSSQQFWSGFRGGRPPDILVSDINFEGDMTSPFPGGTQRPTGLLHAIPFLVWCRVSNRPTAICFHTADTDLFIGTRPGVDDTMRWLALEFGALARVLVEGDAPAVITREDVENWPKLIAILKGGGLARCILAKLQPEERRILHDSNFEIAVSPRIEDCVLAAINAVITEVRGRTYYHGLFQNVEALDGFAERHDAARVACARLGSEKGSLTEALVVMYRRQVIEVFLEGCIRESYQVAYKGDDFRIHGWIRRGGTTGGAPEASRQAIRHYRQVLARRAAASNKSAARIVVDPGCIVELLRRCEHAAQLDVDAVVLPDDEGWPGLDLIFEDGSRDSISVQSLFGEVQRLTPAHCGVVHEYLISLADWSEIYRAARAAVVLFPTGETEGAQELTSVTHSEHTELVRLLIAMFQIVRQYRAAWQEWEYNYHHCPWRVELGEFGGFDDSSEGDSLAKWLDKLRRIIRQEQLEGVADGRDVEDQLLNTKVNNNRSTISAPMRLLLQLLADTRVIRLLDGGAQVAMADADRLRRELPIPSCPEPLLAMYVRPGVNNKKGRAITSLKATLRAPKLERTPERLFGDTAFFQNVFGRGKCPGWLRELCRKYAREDLSWYDEREWPLFLRVKVEDD